MATKTRRRIFTPLREYLDHSRHWHAAVLLTVPLFAIYELGLLLVTDGHVRNAADVLLRDVLQIHGTRGAVVLNGLVLVLFIVAALSGGRRTSPFRYLPLLILESSLWALLLVPVTSVLVPLAAQAGQQAGEWGQLVLSIGAGLYEELLFRLLVVAGGFALLHRLFKLPNVWAASIAVIASSLLFSAYHHLGSGAEPFETRVFIFRFLAGILLSWLFLFRGFAVACWTHAIYDLFCVLPSR